MVICINALECKFMFEVQQSWELQYHPFILQKKAGYFALTVLKNLYKRWICAVELGCNKFSYSEHLVL